MKSDAEILTDYSGEAAGHLFDDDAVDEKQPKTFLFR